MGGIGFVARLLAGDVSDVDLAIAPERYRPALGLYLTEGVVPEGKLRLVLEGSLDAVPAFESDLHDLLLLTRLVRTLPAMCWGSRDQVQLWSVHVRRQRGRERLARMDAEAERGAA